MLHIQRILYLIRITLLALSLKMWSIEIEQNLKHDVYFMGCYSPDLLPSFPNSFPWTLIINTMPSNMEGCTISRDCSKRTWWGFFVNGLSQNRWWRKQPWLLLYWSILSTNTKSEITSYSNIYKTQIVYLNFNSLQPIKV